jgi:hypothetical protein
MDQHQVENQEEKLAEHLRAKVVLHAAKLRTLSHRALSWSLSRLYLGYLLSEDLEVWIRKGMFREVGHWQDHHKVQIVVEKVSNLILHSMGLLALLQKSRTQQRAYSTQAQELGHLKSLLQDHMQTTRNCTQFTIGPTNLGTLRDLERRLVIALRTQCAIAGKDAITLLMN